MECKELVKVGEVCEGTFIGESIWYLGLKGKWKPGIVVGWIGESTCILREDWGKCRTVIRQERHLRVRDKDEDGGDKPTTGGV